MNAVTSINLQGIPHLRSGKVREVYDLGDRLLMVATDRISAFDVVLPNGIPDKGKILNQLSAFWFALLSDVVPNHMITIENDAIARELGTSYDPEQLAGRCMIVRKCEPILLECVARKYLAGSLYKEYIQSGGENTDVEIHGISFPKGLRLSEKLPKTIFTPATKAQAGHDENIAFDVATEIVGAETAEWLRDMTIQLFDRASEVCDRCGIILADTKFEFGRYDNRILLIDEALTPDSSRFWPKETYQVGKHQESLDKQFIRNYLEMLDWDKKPPGPELPESVVRESRERYIEIFKKITGRDPEL